MTVLAIILNDIFCKDENKARSFILSLGGIFLALLCTVFLNGKSSSTVYLRSLLVDEVAFFSRFIFLLAAASLVVLGKISREIEESNKSEFYVLVLLGTMAAGLLSVSANFLPLFLSYEIISFVGLVLVSISKVHPHSSEAAVKLLVSVALSGLFFALGIVLLYGATGSLSILEIRSVLLMGNTSSTVLVFSFCMLFIGILSQAALFPFHLGGPDIAQGAPIPVAAYLSTVPALSAIVIAVRICLCIFSQRQSESSAWQGLAGLDWSTIVATVSAISMTLANLTAYRQTNLKRLLGFTFSAQMAYLLLGFSVANQMGLAAVLFGGAVYVVSYLGAYLISMLSMDRSGAENVEVLEGLVWKRPPEGVALAAFLLSLAALPPFGGFAARFFLISAVLKSKVYWLGIIAVMNSILTLATFLDPIRKIFEVPSRGNSISKNEQSTSSVGSIAMTLLLIPLGFAGVYWDPFIQYISNSLNRILW